MKVPITEKHNEMLADIKEMHVSVCGNLVTIGLSVDSPYEAQTLRDDIENLLKLGRVVALKGNGPNKKLSAP